MGASWKERLSFSSLLLSGLLFLFGITRAEQSADDLIGTWTSKSAKVLTGPGFYNPINDSFTEPYSPGISYSFTATHWESAHYRAISNATSPDCPSAVLQFQHGAYSLPSNGSIVLSPVAVDGRQQLSQPCRGKVSIYERYPRKKDPMVILKKWKVSEDAYKKVKRLDLEDWDGTPVQPLYLAYRPPMMLPTQTMNPTGTKNYKRAVETGGIQKRGSKEEEEEEVVEPLNKGAKIIRRDSRGALKKGLDWSVVVLFASVFVMGSGGVLLLM